ncbi:MAG TPA: hypothetical protein VGR62_01625 [Candidatus Binatia bacterium]|jgi:hypothetical protein|nr:hypothetical protein [Candidatus Binatia bacterium]
MLREALRTLRVESPAWARALGLAHEHAAIAARHRRMRRWWDPHLTASRDVVLAAADQVRGRTRALVVGAGDCLDVPVTELAARFDEVVLADVVIGPAARRLARRSGGRVRCVVWDATGVLERLAAVRRTTSADAVTRLFADADPGPPPGGEPDLVVSASCLSQLGSVPGHALPAATYDDTLPEQCRTLAARTHLAWLARRTGAVRAVVADMARLDVAPDGAVLARVALPVVPSRPPDRTWRWDLAMIPEHSRTHHRVHEVGAWIDA